MPSASAHSRLQARGHSLPPPLLLLLLSCAYTLSTLRPAPPPRYVDTRSASGFTALHFAVACNCVPAILALLAYDAHIDDFNIFDAGEFWISCATKSTPLHIAAISNRLQCAVAILQYFVSAFSLLRGFWEQDG